MKEVRASSPAHEQQTKHPVIKNRTMLYEKKKSKKKKNGKGHALKKKRTKSEILSTPPYEEGTRIDTEKKIKEMRLAILYFQRNLSQVSNPNQVRHPLLVAAPQSLQL